MFKKRSYRKELLDAEQIPKQELIKNLHELEYINTWLGGHAVTLAGFTHFSFDTHRNYRILDVGSGGGDNLRHIARWAERLNFRFELVGVDFKKDCVNYAQKHCREFPEIRFMQSDYRDLGERQATCDIMLACLFCHHLPDEELVSFLQWAHANSKLGVIINDLHRHTLAYHSISWLTRFFSRSRLVKHDAKLSVLRAFSKKELELLLASGVSGCVTRRGKRPRG